MTFKSDSGNGRMECLSWRASAAYWVALSSVSWGGIWILGRLLLGAVP